MTTSILAPTFHLLRKILKYFFSQTASHLPFPFQSVSLCIWKNKNYNSITNFRLIPSQKTACSSTTMLLHVIGQRQPNFINFDSDTFEWAYFKQHRSIKQFNEFPFTFVHLHLGLNSARRWKLKRLLLTCFHVVLIDSIKMLILDIYIQYMSLE